MSTADLRTREAETQPRLTRWRRRLWSALRSHWLFGVVFAVGLVLRAITQVAYRPALLYIDSYSYLWDTTEMVPGVIRPLGYAALLLRPLSVFGDLAVFALVNHLLGLGMAVTVYVLILHHGAPRWLGALAAAPVLLDAYQLQIEQNILAETLFTAMVLAALGMLVWRPRPGPLTAGTAGLLLGLSVTVRLVGQPLIVPAVLFLLLAAGSWRRRLTNAAVATLCFALPVIGYGLLYQQAHGEFALSGINGRVQYARVASFVDCEIVSLPEHLRPLCPTPQEQETLTPDEFAWTVESPAARYEPPPGVGVDDALGEFGGRVRAQQPFDYAWAVVRDFAKFFQWSKTQSPEDPPLERWQFQIRHPEFESHDLDGAVAFYGGSGPAVTEPLTRFLRAYQLGGGYTPGTLLLVALLAGGAGALGLGRARHSALRAACLLFTLAGGGLLLASALYEFSWRYQLPALVLLPVAGALGTTALLGRAPLAEPEGSGTRRDPGGDRRDPRAEEVRAPDHPNAARPLAGPAGVPARGGPDAAEQVSDAAERRPGTVLPPQSESAEDALPAPFDAVDAAALDDFHVRYGEVRLASVAIVIAAYNEAEGIGPVLGELPERVGDLPADVVVVDDGSADQTANVAIVHGAYTCVAPRNRGQGAALRLGYRIARSAGAEYIVTTDADGQYDPADIPVVLEPVLHGEADFVTGSRRLGREETGDPLRRMGVRVFAGLVSALTGQRVTDTSHGLRAMRAEVTAAVTLAQPQYQAAELLIGVLARGYRVTERPTTMRTRRAGSSKKGNDLLYGLRYARVVLSTWWRERRTFRSSA